MATRNRAHLALRPKLLVLAVTSCFAAGGAWANPTGPTVASGSATFGTTGNTLTINNSANAIINWQSFSINYGETTRFEQSSPASAVLNRVTTLNNPSLINGVLYSNGQVFLINPSGISIGSTGVIDVAAFVASSLNLSNSDFLSGRMRFRRTHGAGAVDNLGQISSASGGHVYLVGPAVTNDKSGSIEGVIETPQGETILAAGNRVELVNPGTPNLRVEIHAPNNRAVNLGQIMAEAGRVGIFAGLIDQRGTVSANTAMVTDEGKIVFRATHGVNFASNSTTSATGPGAGTIDVAAGDITVSGAVFSNSQAIQADGNVTVAADPGGQANLVSYGAQSVKAGGALEVRDAGPGSQASIQGVGQSIDAGSLALGSSGGGAFILNSGSDQSIHAAGDIMVASAAGGYATLDSFGTQAIKAGGDLRLQDGGLGSFASIEASGQSIEASSVALASNGGSTAIVNLSSGAQTIRTNGMNAAGEGLAVRSSGGGFATIQQIVTGAAQTIDVRNADRVVIDAAGGPANIGSNGNQDISITGATSGNALVMGTPASAAASQIFASGAQSVTAGLPGQSGSITLYGDTTGGPANTIIVSGQTPGGAQTVSTSGTLSIFGGSATGGSTAGIFANGAGGQQTVTADAIVLHGGGTGSGNSARIGANQGAQSVVAGAGGITLIGGDGANAQAIIAQVDPSLHQQVDVRDGGSISIQGGNAAGANAAIVAPVQVVNVDGDVTLQGGSVPSSGVRIGGLGAGATLTTDLTLNAGGDVVLRGGSGASAGAALGSALGSAQTASVAVHAGGDVLLQAGSLSAGAHIGSITTGTLAGGDVLIDAGGTIALNSNPGSQSDILTLDNITLHAGAISESAGSLIQGGTLSASVQGDIDVAGGITSGPQSIQAGGDLRVHNTVPGMNASIQGSGQTIEARSITVDSNGGTAQILNVGSGDQTIRTDGMNSAGDGLAVHSAGGTATIQQMAPGGLQTIDVKDADRVVVDAVAGVAQIIGSNGGQNLSITGATSDNALVLGSPTSFGASIIGDGGGTQSVTAGLPGQNGSIDIYGNTSGGLNRTFISYFTGLTDPGNAQSVSTSGTLTVIGGAGSHGNNNSGILANAPGGVQRIDAQAIVLQGGSDGTPGGGNGALIGANAGAQTVDVGAGGITEHGGGANSQALIYQRDPGPSQAVNVAGSVLIQGGYGSGGFAGISAPVQLVNVDGDVTLVGGSVPNTGVRIGGFGANNPDLTTNLTLNVGGDVTLLGGNGLVAGEALGGSAAGGQPAKVTVHAGGDITLEPGIAGASARIGTSPLNTASGDVLLDARGNITLDSAGPGAGTFIATLDDVTLHARSITEGVDSSIVAHALSASARRGIDLPGTNRVSQFDADTLLSGDVTFNNASPVLDVTGIDAFPFGALNLTQTGDLLITGNVLAGRAAIAATGDITVGPGAGAPGVSVFALGPQSISAGGALRLQGGDADNGYVEVGSLGPLSIATGTDLSLTGGSGKFAHALLWSLGRMDLSVGGATTLTDGSGQYAWAKIVRPWPWLALSH